MTWPVWPKGNEKALAGYVLASTAGSVRLASPTADAHAAGNLSLILRELYEALLAMDIRWSREMYRADEARQEVRPPDAILRGAGDGTCLDLALLLAGAALGKDLLPVVVVLDGHALIAVSTGTDRRRADSGVRRQRENGGAFTDGLLTDSEVLRELVTRGEYALVECTGFAMAREAINPATPEGSGRTDGLMSYDRATEAGLEQLAFPGREFQFAIDVAYLQDIVGIEVYDPKPDGMERINADLRLRYRQLMDEYSFVAGREEQLSTLDRFIADEPSGYCLVTGDAGTGKTALLAEWLRRLTDRVDVSPVYHFISRQYGTADREFDFFQSLLQQASWAWGRPVNATGSLGILEASWLDLLDAGRPPPGPVVIVIDGVDEIEGWSLSKATLPRELPAAVHVVLSARSVAGTDWRRELGLRNPQVLRLGTFDDAAVRAILEGAGAPAWLLEPEAFAVLTQRAQGDPFYVRLLCDQVVDHEIANLDDLARVEHGLRDYIGAWWADLNRSAPNAEVRTLLSYLTVALAPMTQAELIDISGTDGLDFFSFGPALNTVKRYVRGDLEEVGIAFAHWRLKDYVSRGLGIEGTRQAREAILSWCDRWHEHHCRYALAKGVSHHLEEVANTPPADQGPRLRAIVELTRNHDYQTARVEKVGDGAGLVADMNHLIERLAEVEPIDVSTLATMSLEFVDARTRWLQPAAVFDLARRGQWEEAVWRLELLPAGDLWRTAARLCIAWLAVDQAGDEVRRLLDDDGGGMSLLGELTVRVRGAMARDPQPAVSSPGADDVLLDQAQQIITALSAGSNLEGLSSRASSYSEGPDQSPEFSVDAEVQVLVNAALGNPGHGDALLDAYIDLQGANPYADYRNRALAVLLDAIVRLLPDPAQARLHIVHVVESALNPSPVRFGDSLRFSVDRRAGAAARPDLTETAQDLERTADYLLDHAEGRPAPHHSGGNDLWSFHRRRMAAMAETLAGAGDPVTAGRLLDKAAGLRLGFAGFRAPALLTLAEANLVVRPEFPQRRLRCLELARLAAHNIQDPPFAARMTAMVNCLAQRLEPPADLPTQVEDFVSSPSARAADFGSMHRVGEQFFLRRREDHVAMDVVSQANTIERLALDVFHLPIAALAYANPDHSRSDVLPDGSWVVVPDPAFAPMMATWLSAEVLAANLPEIETTALIARFVPVALSNPTALDTLLARLVGAAPTVEIAALTEALPLARTFEPQSGSEYFAS
ncbi:ATP-binding protein [Kribbella sp. VKM Ac-2568]|uniref:ATP-binding protein n=1 Tax=Kribbella sp. VKM Ac-2568 TaxID=2512219 RepID=UPI001048E07F|nr:ATP-binding protein [Kribbella sp. VKM Ac-2568]TCM45149.1 AAA ATPase-like protein [Kribbella sp. VKM Ac-2568]